MIWEFFSLPKGKQIRITVGAGTKAKAYTPQMLPVAMVGASKGRAFAAQLQLLPSLFQGCSGLRLEAIWMIEP